MTPTKHICPLCGTTMTEAPREKSRWWGLINSLIVVLATIDGAVAARQRHWSEAAYMMAAATFLTVTQR